MVSSSQNWTLSLALRWIGIFTTLLILSQNSNFSHAERASTIIPLYIWPAKNKAGEHSWQPLINAKKAFPQVTVHAIVNVENGPGSSNSPDYTTALKNLKDAGILTLGYVYTQYGNRSESVVQSDIDRWKSLYPNAINGIFFDEMAYENKNSDADNNNNNRNQRRQKKKKSTVSYYTDLTRYAKSKGLNFTVGNPGTDTTREFVNSVDTIIIFETNTGFPGEDRLGGWHADFDKGKWGILPYEIGQLNEDNVRDAKRFVKYIYVTDDRLPNPWDQLATYLNQLFRVLNEN